MKLVQSCDPYLRIDQRACLAVLENRHAKYAMAVTDIEQRRDMAMGKMKGFLGELGYA